MFAELESQVTESNRGPDALRSLAAAYLKFDRKEEVRRVLGELRRRGEGVNLDSYWPFRNRDVLMESLERQDQYRNGGLTHINVQPGFDDLRSDPRFADLVRRVGLPREFRRGRFYGESPPRARA